MYPVMGDLAQLRADVMWDDRQQPQPGQPTQTAEHSALHWIDDRSLCPETLQRPQEQSRRRLAQQRSQQSNGKEARIIIVDGGEEDPPRSDQPQEPSSPDRSGGRLQIEQTCEEVSIRWSVTVINGDVDNRSIGHPYTSSLGAFSVILNLQLSA